MKRVVAAPASFLKKTATFSFSSYHKAQFVLPLYVTIIIFSLIIANIISVDTVFADDISGTGSSEVNAVVKESISVGIDHNGLAFSITPTAVGAFASKSTNIHVYTNAKGYKLYISSKTSETSLKHIDSTVTKPIKTLGVLKGATDSGTGLPVPAIDKDAFTVNSWGYSLDGTNFYGVSYDTPSLLKETDNFTDIGDSITPITFGASADTNMPAGTYQNTVVITATATIVPPNKPAMPSNSGWVTSATISPEATGGVHTVKTYEFYVTQDVDFTPTAGTAANKPSGMELEISKDTGYADGIYYVFSRAIDQADSRSDWSDQITIKLDATKPTTTLASTFTQKANQQTATITCADNKEVASYYFGTKAENELTDIDFTIVSATTNASGSTWSGTETISSAGTYNLFCKDVAGGISEGDNIAYYNYNTVTLLDTIAGTAGNYISANYEATTTGPTYLAMAGMEVNPTTLYTVPTPASKVDNYKGASTTLDSTNAATLTNNNIAINNNNTTIYAFFDRSTFRLTLNREAGFSNVTGDGIYKYGATANIGAEVMDGYNWSHWEVVSGNTPEDVYEIETNVTITQATELLAKNGDSQKPVVTITPTSYNSFSFTATDNVGVTHYCINNSSTKPTSTDACWIAADNSTSYTNSKTGINSANTWYVWAKDARNNVSDVKSVESFAITKPTVSKATVTTKLDTDDGNGGTEFNGTTYALAGTKLYIKVDANSGYGVARIAYGSDGQDFSAEPSSATYTKSITSAEAITATIVDTQAPNNVRINRQTYNTFKVQADDNEGATGYYVSDSNASAPTKDTANTFTWLNMNDTYTVTDTTNTKTYYVWVRDAKNNVSAVKNTATYKVTRSQGENTILSTYYDGTTDDNGACSGGVAFTTTSPALLEGTPVCASATATSSGYMVKDFKWQDSNGTVDLNKGGTLKPITSGTTISTTSKVAGLSGVTYLQDVTSEICDNTEANNNTVYILKDRRYNYGSNDQYSYRVKKLTDAYTDENGVNHTGHCWMNQNLAIKGGSEINSTYSNVAEGYSYIIPDGTATNSNTNGATIIVRNGTHVNGAITRREDNTGAWYDIKVAAAGTARANIADFHDTASGDICPDNWRLPRAYNNSGNRVEFFNLTGNTEEVRNAFNVGQVGHCVGIGVCSEKASDPWSNNYFWTKTASPYSTSENKVMVYSMRVAANNLTNFMETNNYGEGMGWNVRCIAD